jgi:TatD DNase family protein
MSKKKKKQTVRPLPEELGMPFGGVETHAHLDLEQYAEDLDQVLERAARCGVSRLGNVFLGPDAYHAGRALFENRDQVFFLLGVHPHEAGNFAENDAARMEAAFRADPRLRALGEIGLDYYYDLAPRHVQVDVFKAQLALARDLDAPVVIHSRDAHDQAVMALKDLGFADRPVLWHCFGGDRTQAREIESLGWHLSIPGTVTFPKSTLLRQAVAAMDLERLVLETDCPFLSPEPYRGKRNEPAYMAFTCREVALLRDMDPAELWVKAGNTARAFFNLD